MVIQVREKVYDTNTWAFLWGVKSTYILENLSIPYVACNKQQVGQNQQLRDNYYCTEISVRTFIGGKDKPFFSKEKKQSWCQRRIFC